MKKTSRFTLVEMMTVIAIIFIVVGMTLPSVMKMYSRMSLTMAAANLKAILYSAREYSVIKKIPCIVSINIDLPGDMNGDGANGIKNYDDDGDGFIDEDISERSFNTTATNAPNHFHPITNLFGSPPSTLLGRGIPLGESNETDITDETDNDNDGFVDETEDKNIVSRSYDDNENGMIDEGIYFVVEQSIRKTIGSDHPHYYSNECTGIRSVIKDISTLRVSEPVYLKNVLFTRLWVDYGSGLKLVLCNESLYNYYVSKSADPADWDIELFGSALRNSNMKIMGNNNTGAGDYDYSYSVFGFGVDGRPFTEKCSTFEKNVAFSKPVSVIIEIRNMANTDRRLIGVLGFGGISIGSNYQNLITKN